MKPVICRFCVNITPGRWFYVAGDKFVDVGVSLEGWTSVMFQVKAAANARIVLMAEQYNFTDGLIYEVVLGVGGSTRSVIR